MDICQKSGDLFQAHVRKNASEEVLRCPDFPGRYAQCGNHDATCRRRPVGGPVSAGEAGDPSVNGFNIDHDWHQNLWRQLSVERNSFRKKLSCLRCFFPALFCKFLLCEHFSHDMLLLDWYQRACVCQRRENRCFHKRFRACLLKSHPLAEALCPKLVSLFPSSSLSSF